MKGLYGLVAMQYRPAEAQAHFRSLPNGAPLILKRDPNNPKDPNAVQVWSGEYHIGYVKGSQVRPLALAMDAMPAAKAGAPQENIYRQKAAKLAIDGGKWPLVEVEE